MLDRITPMVITFDEAANIGRVLAKLGWAREILVIDSGSTDATLDILGRDPRVRVVTRAFDSFASQCNFGLEHVRTPFVLSMDADYVLSDALVAEMAALVPDEAVSGWRTGFRYLIHGRALRGTLYPPRVTLYRPERGRYVDLGHGHRLAIEGEVRDLSGRIDHDDRKPMARWLASQARYIVREADHLLAQPPAERSMMEKLRAMAWPAPFAALVYALVVKGCLFDGWPGWLYAMQRTYAELLLAMEIVDRRLGGARSRSP